MRIEYYNCTGNVVEEKVTEIEFFMGIELPHDMFMHCHRPNGEIFEINPIQVKRISAN